MSNCILVVDDDDAHRGMRLLGASQEMTPAESFNFWVDRVDARSKQHLWAIHDEFLADKAM